jgi:signal transduction histidine kinase
MTMRTGSIRFRITALAALAVTLVLVAAGFALVRFQRAALTASIDQSLTQRADDLAALIEEATGPITFASTTQEGFAQLVGTDGQVLAASPNLEGVASLASVPPGQSGDLLATVRVAPVDDDQFRVLTRTLAGGRILTVGTTSDIVGEGTAALTGGFAVAIPILVMALGSLVWWLVGKTLRPVDAIRGEVAVITATDLHRRVPNPGTGDEIADLATTMNAMLERLDREVERQRRFVADASHELRTPLTRLRAAMEVEREAGANPGAVDGFLHDTLEMQQLIDDMLYLARADEGQAPPTRVPLDLDDVVLREAARAAAESGKAIDTSAVSGAHVLGDRIQLARVVRNLLDNATRHATTSVTLSLGEFDGIAILLVGDDGPGVDPDHRDRIFDRFTKLDEARAAGNGTGLGLAIARDIAARHDGTLTLLASVGRGATFQLSIPAAP